MNNIAIITGSFDPITSGHEELAKRAAQMFDKVYFVVLANTEKHSGMFRAEDRLIFAERVAENLTSAGAGNIGAFMYSGLTSDAAHMLDAKFIVRGVRSSTDFDYEYEIANIMKRFDPKLETIFLPASPELSCVSSTYVRELVKYGFTLKNSVPDCVAELMMETYRSYSAEL